jgi:hypothetical protein
MTLRTRLVHMKFKYVQSVRLIFFLTKSKTFYLVTKLKNLSAKLVSLSIVPSRPPPQTLSTGPVSDCFLLACGAGSLKLRLFLASSLAFTLLVFLKTKTV